MAGEVEFGFASTKTTYYVLRDKTGRPWNLSGGAGGAFETFVSGNWSQYSIGCTEQGVCGYYLGNFPANVPNGDYNIEARQQLGGSPDQLQDPRIGTGFVVYNGVATIGISDMPTSGLLGGFLPARVYRGEMIKNWPIYLVSSIDHVTPLTSGIVSGQICRDPVSGSVFGPLQSGQFSEFGNGFYTLQALTSGDLLCNTAALIFSAAGVSGGQSDPRTYTLVTQRVSGQG